MFNRAARMMRQAVDALGGVDEALRLAYAFDHGGVRISPTQLVPEIRTFLELVKDASPHRVLEIGTGIGGTLFLLARVSTETATIVSVDIDYPFFRTMLYKAFSTHGQKLHLVIADSHEEGTVAKVKRLFDEKPIELLFIDGDHSYQSARGDFETYGGLVAQGGLIAFHDIVPGKNSGGVPRLWREIQRLYPSVELVENWDQGGFGIGVIRKLGPGEGGC
jgi:predicted O-methyltransferase YrrM